MTKAAAQKYKDLIIAFGEGKEIEFKRAADTKWLPAGAPSFDEDIEFRVKPTEVLLWVHNDTGIPLSKCSEFAEQGEESGDYNAQLFRQVT